VLPFFVIAYFIARLLTYTLEPPPAEIAPPPVNAWEEVLCDYLIAVTPEGEFRYCPEGWRSDWLFGGVGLVSTCGREVSPPVFDVVGSFAPGIAMVFQGQAAYHPRWQPHIGVWGLMCSNGELIQPMIFSSIVTWRGDLRRVNIGGTPGSALAMEEGAYFTHVGGYWGFLHPDGTWAVPPDLYFHWVYYSPCPDGTLLMEHNGQLQTIQLHLR
jgi:hypothetical protein